MLRFLKNGNLYRFTSENPDMVKKENTTAKSIQAFGEACKYLPGGVDSPVRAFRGVDGKPVFIASAKGSKIYDIDGNEYIDYVCSWGPAILGHAHPKVVNAITQAAKKGTSFGAPTLAETKLAKKLSASFLRSKKCGLSAAAQKRL